MKSTLLHPAYFPSILQMAAVAQSKKVIFEAKDNYQKQTYRNRTYIAHSNGILLLNVPILHIKNGLRQKSKDVRVENNFPWQTQHWKSLQSAYRTSPFFEFYEDELSPIFHYKVDSLFEHNLKVHELMCELIGLSPEFGYTEIYENDITSIDARVLINAKSKFDTIFAPYKQVLQPEGEFIPNLSILDLLCNEGPNAIEYLENIPLDFL